MKMRALLGIGLMAVATGVSAAQDPVKACLDSLRSGADAPALASEVVTDRLDVKNLLPSLERRASDLAKKREEVEAIQGRYEFSLRNRESYSRETDRLQLAFQNDNTEHTRSVALYDADGRAFQVACNPAPKSQVASCNVWLEERNRRMARGKLETDALRKRWAEIERRRGGVALDIAGDERRIRDMQMRRTRVDVDTRYLLGECSAGQSRLLALKQIANVPARAGDYLPPNAVAEKALTGLFQSIAREGAVNQLEGKLLRARFKLIAAKLADGGYVVAGKTIAKRAGLVVTVADLSLDVANAGVDQRLSEVTRNLFLVGDYAAVMKQMVDQKGGEATKDAAYIAMRTELDRLSSDMPSTSGQMIRQGLFNAAALTQAFAGYAGNYASSQVKHAGYTVLRRGVPIIDRQVLGKSSVAVFREAISAMAQSGADDTIKNGFNEIMNAIRGPKETPTPVNETRGGR